MAISWPSLPAMSGFSWVDVLEELKKEPRKLAAGAGAATGLYLLWHCFPTSPQKSWPNSRRSPHAEIYNEKKQWAIRKREAHKTFPPPYPNGWVFIFASADVQNGTVLPVDVCGKSLVAFRADKSGVLSVLDAYCSHMGTHLGYGSRVVDDCIECPYHKWAYDTQGTLSRMPYGGSHDCGLTPSLKQREGNNLRSYPVVEKEGMVWVWLHADNEDPWPLDTMNYPKEHGLRPITRIIEDNYRMHAMEPSHNSVDWYHFSTVHSAIGTHWLSKFKAIEVDQEILPPRSAAHGSKDDDGAVITRKDLLVVDEKIKGMRFGNLVTIPEKYAGSFSETQVRFCGPLCVNFHVKFKFFGEMIAIMPLTPMGAFDTHLEFWVFANWKYPWLLAYIVGHFIKFTVSQDREVWEHRVHKWPRNQVKGDFSFSKYDKWLQNFYSASSIKWEDLDFTW